MKLFKNIARRILLIEKCFALWSGQTVENWLQSKAQMFDEQYVISNCKLNRFWLNQINQFNTCCFVIGPSCNSK